MERREDHIEIDLLNDGHHIVFKWYANPLCRRLLFLHGDLPREQAGVDKASPEGHDDQQGATTASIEVIQYHNCHAPVLWLLHGDQLCHILDER